MTTEADHDQLHAGTDTPPAPSARTVVAALAGIAAAWLAAGSTGLWAPALRHGLAGVALAVSVIAVWPPRQTFKERVILLAALVVAVGMMVPALSVYNVLAVGLVLAVLARANLGLDGRLLLLAALASAVLGVYVLASTSMAIVWYVADVLGGALGRVAGAISGRPLEIGATFAGLDFLVLMAVLYAGWLWCTARPRFARAVWAGLAIFGAHLAYLVVLSYSVDLYDALPPAPPPPEFRDYIPPPWSWSDAARSSLPWDLPLLAGVLQVAVAAMMLRWAAWLPIASSTGFQPVSLPNTGKMPVPPHRAKAKRGKRSEHRRKRGDRQSEKAGEAAVAVDWRKDALTWAPIVLAVLVPLVITLAPGQSTLDGKKIIASNRGHLDWEKPVHESFGEASAGMYGMLPEFVASLGGRFEVCDDLSEEALRDADVLLLIHPLGPWPEDQLERIRDFVRQGGSLLVLAETPRQEGELASSYNHVLQQVLDPPGMEVSFDSAASVTWNWQESYTVVAHPAVTGVEDGRNRFGMTSGASIRIRWPARPLLVGRWGWADPGIDSEWSPTYRYDAGERLGDLVLAAEQRLGRGRVVVLSDAFGFSNQGNVTCYVFTGRLLAYLAGGAGNPQAAWRQALGLLGCLALVALVAWPLDPTRLAGVAVVLALALAGSRTISHLSMRVVPDGSQHSPSGNVAYIDGSHMEAYSDAGWGYDGIAGLALTLMRNGHQAFLLPELTGERLRGAGMLIAIAPARPFSKAEQATVRGFVEGGGIFILMVGADRAGPVEPLLKQFDLRVPRLPIRPGEKEREPVPMGNFTTLYRPQGADDDSGLLIYTGWPIECHRFDELVRGFENLPIIALRDVGRGKVVLIGDTAFAMNKNLEYVGGEPFQGRYDNAHFWRWLIGSLTGQEDWLPPRVERSGAEPAAENVPNPSVQGDSAGQETAGPPDASSPPARDADLSVPLQDAPLDEVAP